MWFLTNQKLIFWGVKATKSSESPEAKYSGLVIDGAPRKNGTHNDNTVRTGAAEGMWREAAFVDERRMRFLIDPKDKEVRQSTTMIRQMMVNTIVNLKWFKLCDYVFCVLFEKNQSFSIRRFAGMDVEVLLAALNLDADQKFALAEYNHNQQMIESLNDPISLGKSEQPSGTRKFRKSQKLWQLTTGNWQLAGILFDPETTLSLIGSVRQQAYGILAIC